MTESGFGYEGGKAETIDGVTLHFKPDTLDDTHEPTVNPTAHVIVPGVFTSANQRVRPQNTPQKSLADMLAAPASPPRAPSGVGRVAETASTAVLARESSTPVVAPIDTPSYEIQPKSPHRLLKVSAGLGGLALVAWISLGAYEHFAAEEPSQQPPRAEAALVPGVVPDMVLTPGEPLPSPEPVPTTAGNTTSSPTTQKLRSTPVTPKTKEAVAPLIPPKIPSASASSTTSNSSVKSTPSSTPTPTPEQPTPTPVESRPPTRPDREAINLLGSFVDNNRARDLKDNYQNVNDYLRVAKNGELSFLNSDVVRNFELNRETLYNNSDVTQVVGDTPPWLSADALRNMRDSGGNPARQATAYTDNLLRGANRLFPLVGDSISKATFCNNQLSDNLTQHLQNGDNVSRPDSSNEVIVDDVQRVNDVYVVPVVASYPTKDGSVNLFNWDALIPIDTEGRFVAVTIWQQQLERKATNSDSFTTPPTSEPTDTSNSENSSYTAEHAKKNNDKPSRGTRN
ncbi:MAG: hypothetical protein ABIR37_02715 [Candidatus Saccharimonadales bacterium]